MMQRETRTSLRDNTGSKDIVQYTNFTALGQARMARLSQAEQYLRLNDLHL